MDKIWLPLLFFLAHNLQAMSNSFQDNAWLTMSRSALSKKYCNWYHYIQSLSVIFYVLPLILATNYKWYWYIIILVLTRSFYDYFRQGFKRGAKIGDWGSSPIWDEMLIRLKMPESAMIMFRVIALILAFHFAWKFSI